jgi:hypothetical protein
LTSLLLLPAVTYQGALVPPVQAQTEAPGIQVTAQGAESHFPNEMRFFLSARSPDPIQEVRLFIKMPGKIASDYRAVEFSPGVTITGQTVIRLGLGDSYLPPGSELQYYFELRDRGQRTLRTPSKPFIYEDTRFTWRSVNSGIITVYYGGGLTEERANRVLEASQEAMTTMLPVLGIQTTRPLRIVAYGSYRDMSGAIPFRSLTTQERLVTEGQAFTDERVLLVLGSAPGVRGIAAHEFTHLLVAEAAGGSAIQRVPAWLNEGLAEYGNPEPAPSYDQYLNRAIREGRLKPLWHLFAFSGTPEDIIIAYGHSASVVQFLIDTYGAGKVAELMRSLRTSLDVDQAMQKVYGFDQYGLDTAWRKSMGLEPLPPRQAAAVNTATPPPTPPGLGPTPTPAVAVMPPAPANGAPGAGAAAPPPASGCNGSSPDLAWLALLGAAAGLAVVRRRGRKGLP